MKKILIIGISVIIVLLAACAPVEQIDTTESITEEVQEPTLTPNDDKRVEKNEQLIKDIVNQVIGGGISERTATELNDIGIDNKTVEALREMVISDEEDGLFIDGVYLGTGDAHNGDITVEVTIYEGKIIYIEVLEHSETAPLLEEVFKSIPLEVLKEQSAQEVDAVSGATEASDGYIEAIGNALIQAE